MAQKKAAELMPPAIPEMLLREIVWDISYQETRYEAVRREHVQKIRDLYKQATSAGIDDDTIKKLVMLRKTAVDANNQHERIIADLYRAESD